MPSIHQVVPVEERELDCERCAHVLTSWTHCPSSRPVRATEQKSQFYLFGPFKFFPDRRLLLKDGAPVRIGGRALDLLAALVRKPGEVISKRVLISHAWPRVAVDDANLKVNMAALRRAFGRWQSRSGVRRNRDGPRLPVRRTGAAGRGSAAAAVAGVSEADATEALRQLAAKSLLSIDIDGSHIAYRLLETTRAFCVERLRQDSSHSSIMQRHARYICDLLHRTTSEWAQRQDRKLATNYDRALTDLYAAICSSTVISQALMFQALDAMRRAAEIADELGDYESQLRSLRLLGVNELFVGDPRAALRTFQKFSAVVATHSPDASAESETYLGTVELFLGRLEASRSRLERLWERNLQDTRDSAQAVRPAREVLAIFGYVLPHSRWLTGAPDSAVELALATIAHTNESEQPIFQNSALSYACPVFYWCGLYEECRRTAGELEVHSEKHGFYPRRPIATLYQGALDCLDLDSSGDAIRSMQRSIEELRAANHLARMPYHLCLLAEALTRQMRYDEAEIIIDAALDSIRAQGEEWCLPEALRIRAAVLSGRDDVDGAEAALLVAMRKAQEMAAISWELRAANDLAALWTGQARQREVRDLLEPLLGHFSQGHTTRDLQNAAKLLHNSSPP
jgi:tetratricopeptide (TPR) repeat protein